jgi:hypothetical protein
MGLRRRLGYPQSLALGRLGQDNHATTDSGVSEPYVGAVEEAILTINPALTIVDISHDVARSGWSSPRSFFLLSYLSSRRTIYVGVVDPGVARNGALILVRGTTVLIDPTNGVVSLGFETMSCKLHSMDLGRLRWLPSKFPGFSRLPCAGAGLPAISASGSVIGLFVRPAYGTTTTGTWTTPLGRPSGVVSR